MRIFAIKNEYENINEEVAYLLYYEKEKTFFIEIKEDIDPLKLPYICYHFRMKNEYTVNSYWSKEWVNERIVPRDRQNIGMILNESGLDEYDEFSLLLQMNGRCSQDDFYIKEKKEIPEFIRERFEYKIEEVISLDKFNLLLFFRNGKVKKCDLSKFIFKNNKVNFLITNIELFNSMNLVCGGFGINFANNIFIQDKELYDLGGDIPLSKNDFKKIISFSIVNTKEACEILDCSRQNIDDLIKRGKINPVKEFDKNKLFLKSDIIKRNW